MIKTATVTPHTDTPPVRGNERHLYNDSICVSRLILG